MTNSTWTLESRGNNMKDVRISNGALFVHSEGVVSVSDVENNR